MTRTKEPRRATNPQMRNAGTLSQLDYSFHQVLNIIDGEIGTSSIREIITKFCKDYEVDIYDTSKKYMDRT